MCEMITNEKGTVGAVPFSIIFKLSFYKDYQQYLIL